MITWIGDVWASFTTLPLWVRIWVGLILVPVNLVPLGFLGQPFAWPIAALSVGGMIPNLVFLIKDRKFGPVMAVSHLVLWPPLIVLAAFAIAELGMDSGFAKFLVVLLFVDLVSIGFDLLDARKWMRSRP